MYAVSLEASLELAGLALTMYIVGFSLGALTGGYFRFLQSGGGLKCD